MSVQIRRRREAASFLASFVGAQGELLVDTTNNRVQVHDGTTVGGWPAAKLTEATSAVAITGGAINGTPIGATTPSTGAFSSLSAASTVTSTGTLSGYQVNDRAAAGYLTFYRNLGTTSFYDSGFGGNVLSFSAAGLVTAPGSLQSPTIKPTTSLNLPSYTVATLPAAGAVGRAVFCSNGRMTTSTAGALESSGSGTGGLVTDNGAAWKIAGTNITVSA